MNRKKYRVIDAHCDTVYELMMQGGNLVENSLCVSLDKLTQYGGYLQFFAAWIDDKEAEPLSLTLRLLDRMHREIKEHENAMGLVLSAMDAQCVLQQGKVGALLTVENGNSLEGELSNLQLLYDLGVRALTLTWNAANELADGIMEPRGGGLTEFGKSVVIEMNRLGMMIDVSHLSEKGFWDVLSLSKQPVMASHSNARSVASHCRNLTDEQIRALSQSGGVIGLNVYPAFLTDHEGASLSDCMRHIEHILAVGGEDCLGLGSDFDGFSAPMAEGLASPADYVYLFEALKQQGYSDLQIEKLSCGNFLRFMEKIL